MTVEYVIQDCDTHHKFDDPIECPFCEIERLKAEIKQYETVIIPSWKREEAMWREDEITAIEFRRVLAEELDKRDATIVQLKSWLRDYQPRLTHGE